MKHTVRSYALEKNISTLQLFNDAWNVRFHQAPDRKRIREDLDMFLNVGAVPPYVSYFLEKKTRSPRWSILAAPYWVGV